MIQYPFEASFDEVSDKDLDRFVSAVFSSLESEFLVLPKGDGFVEYPVFEQGYEALKQATAGFRDLDPDRVLAVALSKPISVIVLRTMLGFTPPEWAYVTTATTGVAVSQGFARSLDRRIRMDPLGEIRSRGVTPERLRALIAAAIQILTTGAPAVPGHMIHRLDKSDTAHGLQSIRSLAEIGAPYAMLLYERFLSRPFAAHRDSVSEIIGDNLEAPIEEQLSRAGISFRKTKRAERVPGFDQAPDFIVPSEFNPSVVIEAKITEDDGTARDKVTRIQHLAALSLEGRGSGEPRFEVVACISGRGFGVRREDMKKMLLATRGKVFTLRNLDRLVECTRLSEFRTKS